MQLWLWLLLAQNAFIATSGGVAVIDAVAGRVVYPTQTASQTAIVLDARIMRRRRMGTDQLALKFGGGRKRDHDLLYESYRAD